jgi:hypothetical protein
LSIGVFGAAVVESKRNETWNTTRAPSLTTAESVRGDGQPITTRGWTPGRGRCAYHRERRYQQTHAAIMRLCHGDGKSGGTARIERPITAPVDQNDR